MSVVADCLQTTDVYRTTARFKPDSKCIPPSVWPFTPQIRVSVDSVFKLTFTGLIRVYQQYVLYSLLSFFVWAD